MNISSEDVRVLCKMQGLTVPDNELEDIATRMSTWLTALEQIEEELGDAINAVDPIPPVYRHPDF